MSNIDDFFDVPKEDVSNYEIVDDTKNKDEKDKAPKYKLNIFDVLSAISKCDPDFWESLTEEERKAFQPLVVMRWLSGDLNNPMQMYMLNHLLNHLVFTIGNGHKELMYNLMTLCSGKSNTKYKFLKRKKDYKFSKSVLVLSTFYNFSKREADMNLQFYTNDDIIQMAEGLGYSKTELKKLKDELKKR